MYPLAATDPSLRLLRTTDSGVTLCSDHHTTCLSKTLDPAISGTVKELFECIYMTDSLCS